MKRIFSALLSLCICCGAWAQQQEAIEKAGLLMEKCSFAPRAEAMVLRDEAEWSLNSDQSLHLDRRLILKFFKDRKADKQLSDILFYPSPAFESYHHLSVSVVDIDATTKAPVHRDPNARLNSIYTEHSPLKLKAGTLLVVHYTLDFPYNEKLPAWRFQSPWPTAYSSITLTLPETIQLREKLTGNYTPEVQRMTESLPQARVDNKPAPLKYSEHYYQLNEVPAYEPEPFSDAAATQFAALHLLVSGITIDGKLKSNFLADQQEKIVEQLSTRPDFMLRLAPALPIRSEYDRLIRSLSNKEEKMARIYDLVRRHIRWNGNDSIIAHYPLAKVWDTQKGNSTEINLCLIKLLKTYGYEATPLLVSTRRHGRTDSAAIALSDFNRTVACVKLNGKNISLDATARNYDYPMLPPEILNSRGLLISMDTDRLIEVYDTSVIYQNSVTELGHYVPDSFFATNVYINSSGYAKAEHVDILERDSLMGLKRYFEQGNKQLRMRHFLVVNEYVDTLPLSQEFDIRLPVTKKDNLCSAVFSSFALPDTLLSITEDRHSGVNFGYRQQYDLVSEFSFPSSYEVYLMPDEVNISALNGKLRFSSQYHQTSTNFSLRQSLSIDKSLFDLTETAELAKFLKKIAYMNKQKLMLKKNN